MASTTAAIVSDSLTHAVASVEAVAPGGRLEPTNGIIAGPSSVLTGSKGKGRKRLCATQTGQNKTRAYVNKNKLSKSSTEDDISSLLSDSPATSRASLDSGGSSELILDPSLICNLCKEEMVCDPGNFEVSYLACSICSVAYHGEWLSIEQPLLPYLYVIKQVGGWCCAICIRNTKRTDAGNKKGGSINQTADNNFQHILQADVSDISNDIGIIKAQLLSITEFLGKATPVTTHKPSGYNSAPFTNSQTIELQIAMPRTLGRLPKLDPLLLHSGQPLSSVRAGSGLTSPVRRPCLQMVQSDRILAARARRIWTNTSKLPCFRPCTRNSVSSTDAQTTLSLLA